MNKGGIILIAVGTVLLASNFGLMRWDWLRLWWPAILIVVGLWSLISNHRPDNRHESVDPEDRA